MKTNLKYLVLLLMLTGGICAQENDGGLSQLYLAKKGGLIHYSSTDSTGGNNDRIFIGPGEKKTLVDHHGAGIVKRWWLTISPRNNTEILRHLIIRCYWDGESQPSVEVPVADFFGMGFGEEKDYISMPLNITSGGFNCYWPMPFKTSARITVENRGTVPVESFYYNIDIRTFDKLSNDALYFHAQFRKTRTTAGHPVTLLETKGKGHYVGTLLSMQPEKGNHLWYLEGDERVFIDGEKTPSIIGTGTEDYFSSGWYFINGEYSAPFHGVTIKDEDKGRINAYRWHIEDPIPFKKSLLFQIEHGGTNSMSGVEYSSVSFWYQTHPHPEFPPLPEHLMPLTQLQGPTIEAEQLLDKTTVTHGELQVQDMTEFKTSSWGNNAQLWWLDAKPGDELTIPIEVDEEQNYELVGFFTRAQDYGIFQVLVNHKVVSELVDGFADKVENTGPISFGQIPFKKGKNEITIRLVGKDVRSEGTSDGYLIGVDGFHLFKE